MQRSNQKALHHLQQDLFPLKRVLRRSLQMADKSESGALEDDEFVLFYKMLTQREEVLAVFRDFSTDGQTLSVRELEEFLQEGQLVQDDTQQHAIELIQRCEPSEAGTPIQKTYLSYLTRFCPWHR